MIVLTPEANAEVRRNLLTWTRAFAGFAILMVLPLAIAVDPGMGTFATDLTRTILGAFCVPLLAASASTMILAYPLGCWPALLSARRAADLLGIDPNGLSQPALRTRMKSLGFWTHFLMGSAVGGAFAAMWFLTAWAMRGKGFPSGLLGPAALLAVCSGGIASRAWVVRQLVSERQEAGAA